MHEGSPRYGAIIVAGGRSRRMGRDKAWLEVGHEHLLQRIVRLARSATRSIVVVASRGQSLPALAEAVRVDDPPDRAGRGPVAGVLTGLEALSRSNVELAFLGSVDSVRLTTAHVVHMLELLQAETDHHAVVPETARDDGSIVHGLSGAVRVLPAIAAARALLRSSQGPALHTLYEALSSCRVPADRLPDPGVVRGCNTPEQWYEALAALNLDA
jgi:molybdenum cofactor guanylyltransferase